MSKFDAPFLHFPEIRPFEHTARLLHLTDAEVGKFYKLFLTIDGNHSYSVDITEVYVHLHVEKSRFNRRVFGLLDFDGSGELNFEEFMVGIWNYCSLSDDMFEHFAFDLYDIDHSGNIDVSEAQLMIKDIYGIEFDRNARAKLAFQKLGELETLSLNFPAFSAFVRKHKAILYPAYSLQLSIKKYFIGKSFWKRQALKRLELSGGQYRSVFEILGKGWKRNSNVYTRFTGSIPHEDEDEWANQENRSKHWSAAKKPSPSPLNKQSPSVKKQKAQKSKSLSRQKSRTILDGSEAEIQKQYNEKKYHSSKKIRRTTPETDDIEDQASQVFFGKRNSKKLVQSQRQGKIYVPAATPLQKNNDFSKGSRQLDESSDVRTFLKGPASRKRKTPNYVRQSSSF